MGSLHLLLGGQKSGKSSAAAALAAATGRPVVVVAPAEALDDEFAARIARHRADRPDHWTTLETFDLAGALGDAPDGATVLVDALDTWLLQIMEETDDAAETVMRTRLDTFLAATRGRAGDTIVIAGQPGLGPIAADPFTRHYVDLHGLACQQLAGAADVVEMVVAGRRLPLGPSASGPVVPPELRQHGDTQIPAGALDLAVNVTGPPPAWVTDELADVDLTAYPDDGPARQAIATRHGRPVEQCLPLNGAAEAFPLLAQAVQPRHAVCVHPEFTAPEAALRAAGVPVTRVLRDPDDGWRLDPAAVPTDADLVVLGRPSNPTGALDPLGTIEALQRPGRTVVVDEAFAEVLDEAGGVASRPDLAGVVAVRSLTKLWGLAGLRVGYLTGPSELVARLEALRQPWSCSAPALHALERLCTAEEERAARAAEVRDHRNYLLESLREVAGVTVWDSDGAFVLVRSDAPDLRERLLEHGVAVRRGDTFPGLDPRYVRVAVRGPAVTDRLAEALRR